MAGLFARFAAMFEAEAEAAPAHDPAAVALAALMVRLAKADGVYDAEERADIRAALDQRFGAGDELLAAGEAAEADAVDNRQFTSLLKAAHDHDSRGALLEDLWTVVLSDGARDAHEDALMRQIGGLLHVSDVEIGRARRRVTGED